MNANCTPAYARTFLLNSLMVILILCFTQCTKEEDFDKSLNDLVENETIDISSATEIVELSNGSSSDKNFSNRRTFKTINAALRCIGINATLFSGNKTIFAPTDAAFEKLGLTESNICNQIDREHLQAILNYHIVPSHIEKSDVGCIEMLDGNTSNLSDGKRYKLAINGNDVVLAYSQLTSYYDLNVFIIEEVLGVPTENIIESMMAEPDLTYLVDIINALPELKEALEDETSFVTLFAPTDKSMRKLLVANSAISVDRLIEKLGAEVLQQILSYHIVDDCTFTSGFSDIGNFNSVQGGVFQFNQFRDGIVDEMNNLSRFVTKGQDIHATNGIIHKIKDILMPNLDISESGLNIRHTINDVNLVKSSIINTFSTIDAIGVAAQISHSSNAESVGLSLNPTELILFGNPNLGTPIMQENQQAGIDLPQKYLIYEDNKGITRIAYNDISYLKARHGLSDNIPTLGTMTGALNNFASQQSDRMPGPIVDLPEKGEGLIDKLSNNSFEDSYNIIFNAITNNPNLRLILNLDHQANAGRVGLDLRPTRLIVFGNPNLGTPLMKNAQSVAIDLPQKILIWEDENQNVHITYNDPLYLKSRHDIRNQENILNIIATALNNISNAGAGL